MSVVATQPENWFGPVEVAFGLPVQGSPYDGALNDVQVAFVSADSEVKRLAFFDGQRWRAVLLADAPRNYRAHVLLNGMRVKALPGIVRATQRSSPPFIRIDKESNRFRTASGKPYWPVGHNLGWQSANFKPNLIEQLELMGRNGLNWSRIWSCHWDGKNPYWLEKKALSNPRDMHPEVLDRWDAIIAAASKAGVQFQWVLFHHGMFSSRVNPNWQDHPWNTAKGGFLAKPEEFFTHPEAIRRSKNWLRYAVARWGHEPAIMAWELFNEVEWVDAIQSNPASVGKWHEEMAAYLRQIDPYKRLVTSSSGMELPIWKSMDFYQPHGYPPSVRAMVMGAKPTDDKPLFYGEVGVGEGSDDESQVIREALWSGLMAGHAGAAQYWYWDRMNVARYREFAHFTSFLARHKLGQGKPFRPMPIEVRSRQAGDVRFAPGMGWARTTQYRFVMPQDAFSGALGKLSGFIQGPAKKDMMAEPIQFEFESGSAGRFEMRVSSVAQAGAAIQLSLDGQLKVDEKVDAGSRDITLNKTYGLDFGPGKHTVLVANPGPDWYVAASFRIDGVGHAVAGTASTSGDRVLLWLERNAPGAQAERFVLAGHPAGWSRLRVAELDLDTGKTSERLIRTTEGKVMEAFAPRSAIWLLTKA